MKPQVRKEGHLGSRHSNKDDAKRQYFWEVFEQHTLL